MEHAHLGWNQFVCRLSQVGQHLWNITDVTWSAVRGLQIRVEVEQDQLQERNGLHEIRALRIVPTLLNTILQPPIQTHSPVPLEGVG